jgi:acyl-CoA thioester hydrolase
MAARLITASYHPSGDRPFCAIPVEMPAKDSIAELLTDFPVVTPFTVLWGDQDAIGHVNNIVYLRWSETARVAYLDRIGLWGMLGTHSRGPIVASISCDYRQPVNYPDTVHVGARVSRIGNSSFTMDHRIVGESAGAIVAEVSSTVVFFDYKENRSLKLPDDLRRAISKLEGRTL